MSSSRSWVAFWNQLSSLPAQHAAEVAQVKVVLKELRGSSLKALPNGLWRCKYRDARNKRTEVLRAMSSAELVVKLTIIRTVDAL